MQSDIVPQRHKDILHQCETILNSCISMEGHLSILVYTITMTCVRHCILAR